MCQTLKRSAIALGSLALAGGCALPLPIVIAGYAADGISVAASDKTLTDHALSAVADEDCALWRVVTDEDICMDDGQPIDIMVASANGPVVFGASTQPVERFTADGHAPAHAEQASAIAVLPADAPIGAIAALATARGYDEIRNSGGGMPLSAAVAGAPTAPGISSVAMDSGPGFDTLAPLGFEVPLPPMLPARRGAVATLSGTAPSFPLPPRIPAERG